MGYKFASEEQGGETKLSIDSQIVLCLGVVIRSNL